MDNLSNIDAGTVPGLAELKRRSFSGIGALIKRQVVIKALTFLANIALARLLAPQVFGVYAIVLFVVQFFSAFGDAGIGAALIQKKGELTREELSSTFWLQQMLVWVVVCVALAAAPLALRLYPALPSYGGWLIRAMAFSFALTSLKTIPAILMERKMDFRSIVIIDIAETAVFYSAALLLALAGFEVWGFIIAALLRSLAGTALIYTLTCWRPSFSFTVAPVRELVRFGLPYQGTGILSFFKDAVTPLFIGMYCGASAVGFVNWAKTFAFAPLILSEAFGRVAFPAFSRIQGDRELLARAIERAMRSITLIMFPITALMIALGPEMVRVLFTDKWLPALPAYYFYCTSPLVIGVVLPMYSAILSLGKSGIILKMTAALLVLEWGLGVPLVLLFGFNGVALTQPITAGLFYFVYKRVLGSENIHVALVSNVKWQFLAAVAAGLLCKKTAMHVHSTSVTLPAMFCAGLVFYVGMMYVLDKKAIGELMTLLRNVAGRTGGTA